jgi:hypothetical protein
MNKKRSRKTGVRHIPAGGYVSGPRRGRQRPQRFLATHQLQGRTVQQALGSCLRLLVLLCWLLVGIVILLQLLLLMVLLVGILLLVMLLLLQLLLLLMVLLLKVLLQLLLVNL